MAKLVVFDVDGTLVTTKSGETFRNGADDWQWLPGRLVVIQALNRLGIYTAIATNQGGVAFGHMTYDAILNELLEMRSDCNGNLGVYLCCNHPKAPIEQYRKDDERRKPGPGMLLEAMKDFDVQKEETVYVGDRPEDEEAAKNAGVKFYWVQDFFGGEEVIIG